MKDKSEVIVDLAYASLMYNSRDMVEKVRKIQDEMEDLKYAVRVKVIMAARTKEEAKQLSGILQIASAADRIARYSEIDRCPSREETVHNKSHQ